MGCAGSKQQAGGDVAVADVYRPPPTSVSLFDISAVEEPWLIAKKNKEEEEEGSDDEDDEESSTTTSEEEEDEDEKHAAKSVVPLPLLDKLEGYELAPASWSEVSKALEDMKPVIDSSMSKVVVQQQPAPPPPPKKKKKKTKKTTKKKTPPAAPVVGNNNHNVEAEAEAAAAADKPTAAQPPPELAGRRVVKDNPFLMRDRESAKGAAPRFKRRDPFEGCPERRPPGASGGGVVLYTTSLRGVRRTFEDCERAREAVEACAAALGVPGAVDERDVSLHGEYLREVRELAGDGAPPPRLFVMGRYVGGAEEVLALADSGRLREMMRWAKARGDWEATTAGAAARDARACEGCGGARFVPCWECGGSCKVVVVVPGHDDDDGDHHQHRHHHHQHQAVERCAKCNENGLMMCPICH